MFTCCPHCQTCFRITKAQLDVAQGKVRCGHCKEVFNGKQHLRESLAASEPETSPPAAPVTEPTPSAIPPTPPEAEKDSSKSAAVDFDMFDLSSIPASESEAKDWFEDEEADKPTNDLIVVESDEWLDEADEDDDVTLNLDMNEYEYEPEDDEDEEETSADADPEILPDKADNNAPSRYEYIEEEIPQEQQDIDQFIAEVNAQLSEAIEEPGKDELFKKAEPFKSVIDMDADVRLEPEVEESKELPSSRTDDEFKQAFLANLDSGLELELEPTSPEPMPEAIPEPAPSEPIFPAAPKPAKTEARPEMEALDDILTTAKQPTTRPRPPKTDEIPFHLRDSLLVEEKKRSPIKLILAVLAILVFSIVLFGQLAYFRNSQLVDKVPALQPMVEKFCNTVPCIYSGPRDVSQFKLVSRDVRLHPKVDNALLISAAFINRAAFKQPYPDITITLSDLSGAMVAQRQFKPAEYLGQLNSPFLLMPSGKPVQIALEVVDPGKDAVNFEFTFQ